jgi:trehalose 6-phosphate phosphatase
MDETMMQRGVEPHRKLKALPPPASLDLSGTALLLDVDGTLLDIATTPDGVVVPNSLRESLRALLAQSGGAVALVSGRTIDKLDRLFAPLKCPAIGGHGAEMRLASEGPVLKRRPPLMSDALRQRLHALAAVDPRLLVEDKLHSIALHYRLAPKREAELKRRVTEVVADNDSDRIEILFGKAVIDVKPKDFNKGTAVIELMNHPPFAGRMPFFVGDDTTDESVFAILPGLSGTGFSVEREMNGADGVIPSPEHVRSWLMQLSADAGRSP